MQICFMFLVGLQCPIAFCSQSYLGPPYLLVQSVFVLVRRLVHSKPCAIILVVVYIVGLDIIEMYSEVSPRYVTATRMYIMPDNKHGGACGPCLLYPAARLGVDQIVWRTKMPLGLHLCYIPIFILL